MRATLAGTGTEKIDVLPGAMRMVVRLEAKADTLDQAIPAIQKQIDEVKAKLAPLSPLKDTLEVKGPHLAGAGGNEQERMMRQMRRMGRRFQKDDEDEPAKKKVALGATVTAEWKLNGADLVSLLRESDKLRTAIEKAMPEDAKEKKGETDEEEDEETAEERMLMEMQMGDEEGGPKAGQPTFLYVAEVDKAGLAKARRAAFLKAKQNAQETAETAGVKLGALVGLTAGVNAVGQGDEWGMSSYARRMMYQQLGISGSDVKEAESVSPGLKNLTFAVHVTATFAFE